MAFQIDQNVRTINTVVEVSLTKYHAQSAHTHMIIKAITYDMTYELIKV